MQGINKKEGSMRKIILAILAVIVLAGAFAGCNATRGAGEDIKSAGQHIANVGN